MQFFFFFFFFFFFVNPRRRTGMATKAWFDVSNGVKKRPLVFDSDKKHRSLFRSSHKSQTLGILAFDTAKTMSRLVCLHKSISDEEVTKLRKEIVRLQGVSYLISKDEDFLLNLAYLEKMEDLDSAAVVVARLGRNCSHPDLINFEPIFTDIKLGLIDLDHFLESKAAEKTIEKVEKYISMTSELHSALESLSEMEMSERKIKHWKDSGPIPGQKGRDTAQKPNYNLFESKIAWQRQQVRHLKQVSLWGHTFNKTVRIMARTICIVYARLRIVFSPYVTKPSQRNRVASQPDLHSLSIDKSAAKGSAIRSKSGPIGTDDLCDFIGFGGSKLMQQAAPSTAGGSGLSLRYANVILILERYMQSSNLMEESGREDLYQMLPRSITRLVKAKLKNVSIKEVEQCEYSSLAEGLKAILEWLAPMARHTIRWQMERNVEKQNFDPKPKVLLLQTLFFADKNKSEEAIAEILVGLSFIYKYQIQHSENIK